VKALSEQELEEFLDWLARYGLEFTDAWDKEIERDAQPGGRLDAALGRVRKDIAEGKTHPNPHVRNGYLRKRFRSGRFHGLVTASFVFAFRQATLDHVCFHAVPKSPVFTRSEAGSARKCSFLRADLGWLEEGPVKGPIK
jgi:hypothetical protein